LRPRSRRPSWSTGQAHRGRHLAQGRLGAHAGQRLQMPPVGRFAQ
jgi:hypothetical protein